MNLGNTEELKLEDIAKKIIEISGSASQIIFEKPPAYTQAEGLPDMSLAKERLAWFPLVKLDDGLAETVEAMKGSRVLKPLTPLDAMG